MGRGLEILKADDRNDSVGLAVDKAHERVRPHRDVGLPHAAWRPPGLDAAPGTGAWLLVEDCLCMS